MPENTMLYACDMLAIYLIREHHVDRPPNVEPLTLPARPPRQSDQRDAEMGLGAARHPAVQRRVPQPPADQRLGSGERVEPGRAGRNPHPLQQHPLHPREQLIVYRLQSMDNIDRQITQAERKSLLQTNAALTKQNQLLKGELNQLKTLHAHSQKELAVYKGIVLNGSSDRQVLEMQHQRIFELQTQLELLHTKYTKMLKSGGSEQLTELTMKCRDYERRLKQSEDEHKRQMGGMREKLMKQNATEFMQSKRVVMSPVMGQVKKSSLAVRKFV